MSKTVTSSEVCAYNKSCASAYMGLWLYETTRFMALSAKILSAPIPVAQVPKSVNDDEVMLYSVDNNGIASISIVGPMMKADSKFGGTSTVRVRRAIRTASTDTDVRGILIYIDSGGGTVAGTEALGNDIAVASKVLPVVAHIEDLGASAAIWAGSQASYLSANSSALVGSIGVAAMMYDTSGEFEQAGIKAIPIISDGAEKFKMTGVDGVEISDEQIAYWQNIINNTSDLFISAVAKGRKMSVSKVRKLADGRVHLAADALELGLIDSIGSEDQARERVTTMANANDSQRIGKSRSRRRAELRLAIDHSGC